MKSMYGPRNSYLTKLSIQVSFSVGSGPVYTPVDTLSSSSIMAELLDRGALVHLIFKEFDFSVTTHGQTMHHTSDGYTGMPTCINFTRDFLLYSYDEIAFMCWKRNGLFEKLGHS